VNNSKENCPHCSADLQGEPIPKKQQGSYNSTHFTRKIGISDIEKDRIVKWKCPDCQGEWDLN
jgi:transposase-like protein